MIKLVSKATVPFAGTSVVGWTVEVSSFTCWLVGISSITEEDVNDSFTEDVTLTSCDLLDAVEEVIVSLTVDETWDVVLALVEIEIGGDRDTVEIGGDPDTVEIETLILADWVLCVACVVYVAVTCVEDVVKTKKINSNY